MSREVHVRFCEGAGVKFPRATHRNVYVKSRLAGERVLASLKAFLSGKLRLKVCSRSSIMTRSRPPTIWPNANYGPP